MESINYDKLVGMWITKHIIGQSLSVWKSVPTQLKGNKQRGVVFINYESLSKMFCTAYLVLDFVEKQRLPMKILVKAQLQKSLILTI